jgi:dihydroorotate dehydrogenase (fumarate)
MSDLTTRYLGFTLKSPLVASASPVCESVANIRELEDAGVGAVVLPSLFEEQLELESNTLDDDLWRGAQPDGCDRYFGAGRPIRCRQ